MRDIRLTVLLSPEEYVALDALAEETGDSHSGLMRRLLKRELRTHAHSMADERESETAGPAQVLRMEAGK